MKKVLLFLALVVVAYSCSKNDDPLAGQTTIVDTYKPYIVPGNTLETVISDKFKWYVHANGEEQEISSGIENKNGNAQVTWSVYYKNEKSADYIRIDTGALPTNNINKTVYSKYTFPKSQTGVYRLYYYTYFNGKKETTTSDLFFLYDRATYKKGQWANDLE